MSEQPSDTELLEHAHPYALDAMSEVDRRRVEALLDAAEAAQADAFRAIVRDIRDTLADLTAVDAREAPPELEARIQRALDRQLGLLSGPPASVTALRRIPPGVRWLAAAALVAALALGAVAVIDAVRQPDSGTLTAQQVRTRDDARSAGVPITGGGTADVISSRELDAAVLTFDALPTPPDGRVYQLWLIPEGGQPRSAGVLTTVPTDRAPLLIRLDSARVLAVSIEPVGGSTQPTTDPIVAVPLA
ncbi:anti-sigma factor [Nocardia inohanensis]|uniref:anti-sigma factor n=1 Tax=Nocardia inohanensis TaxID=209246 RepID=UPI00083635C2|nr:anti-sigma factor [Nocardia inohanensis]